MNNNIYNEYYIIIKYLNEINNDEYLLDEFKFFDSIKSYLKGPQNDEEIKNPWIKPNKNKGIIEKIVDKISNKMGKLIDKLSNEANIVKEINDKQQVYKLPKFKNEKNFKAYDIHFAFTNNEFYSNVINDKNKKNKLFNLLKNLNKIFEKSLNRLRIRFIADKDQQNVRPYTFVGSSIQNFEINIVKGNNNINNSKLLNNPLYKEFLHFFYAYNKGNNITFSRSKHTINFNMASDAEIYIGERCFNERSSKQLTATCLHELGHHVFTKAIAFRNASRKMENFSKDYLKELSSSILNPDNKNNYLEKSKLYSLKFLIGIVLYFSYFINYLTMNKSEKAADDFCVMCGYGKYLSQNLNPSRERQKKIIFNFQGLKNIFAKNKKISDTLEYLGKWILIKGKTSYYTNADLRAGSLENNKSKTINDQEFYDSLDSKLVTENIELVLELFNMYLNENYIIEYNECNGSEEY